MSSATMELEAKGWVRLSREPSMKSGLDLVERRLQEFGSLYRIFKRHPLWKPLHTDPTRPLGRSGGIGENSLHIDCVNMESPPRLVALHCVRADPAGGGLSRLAPTRIVNSMPGEVEQELKRPIFDEGAAFDLKNAGECLRDFPILSGDGWTRWSGRFLEVRYDHPVRDALIATERALNHATERINLQEGETLVVDQRRYLHGRDPLGSEQESIPESSRRLLVQCYIDPEGVLVD